jgi:uncharacterized protein YjbI with pentapeptide repeats
MRVAAQRRRADLGESYDKMAAYFGWQDQPEGTYLIDRPASPERGQLLNVLISGGVRNLEALTFVGLDLSFASLKGAEIGLLTAQQARLSYADFSGSYFTECDFGAANLENARFRLTKIVRSRFAALSPDQVRAPLPAQDGPTNGRMAGVDFSRAVIIGSDFSGAVLTVANFDGAVLKGVSFKGADLSLATFRDTVILAADLDGATLKRADLDGAIVFGADFLTDLASRAAPDTFVPTRFRLDPVPLDDVLNRQIVFAHFGPEEIAALTGDAKPFRVMRIQPF